jgi:hypothetical protein
MLALHLGSLHLIQLDLDGYMSFLVGLKHDGLIFCPYITGCMGSNHNKRPIPTQEKFPRTEKKVENFQLQNFFPTENLCWQIKFDKFFFLLKIFRVEITVKYYLVKYYPNDP